MQETTRSDSAHVSAFAARSASLHKAARDIQRQIYASLPIGERVLDVIVRIASESSEYASMIRGFGRAIYAEFLRAGVKDMPPIRGVPVENIQLNLKDRNLALKLPEGYGADFGAKAWRTAFKITKNPDLAASAIAEYAAKVAKSPPYDPTNNLKQAEFFALRGVQFAAQQIVRNFMRDRDREGLGLDVDHLDDEGRHQEIHIRESDPHAIEKFEDVLSRHDVQKLVAYLNQTVHPDAGLYFSLSAEGYEDSEILGQEGPNRNTLNDKCMLPHMRPEERTRAGFWQFKRKKLWPAVERFFQMAQDAEHRVEVEGDTIKVQEAPAGA